VGAVNRGGQTRRRAVPASPADADLLLLLRPLVHGGGASGRRSVRRPRVAPGRGVRVVAVAAPPRPQRADGHGRRVLDDDPRAPEHGERQHFQRLGRRYGHHVVPALGRRGHRGAR